MQRIIDLNDHGKQPFTFIESTFDTEEQLLDIIHNEKHDSQLFNLAQALVFRCHLVYYKQISSNDLLTDKDTIIFNFHHALFDFPSMNVFFHDLDQAYKTSQLTTDDNTTLRYLDCEYKYFFFSNQIKTFVVLYSDTVIEQEIPMTGASIFWLDALHNCHVDRSLPLPYDRYRLSNEHRTGLGTSILFDFGQDLSYHFLAYASSNNITFEYLALTCYYAFLFKLTNGERDLCIGMNTHGRYKEELIPIIGLFNNTIPLRCRLNPYWSFHELFKEVKEMMTASFKYSYFPLQRILDQHPNVSKAAFLDTTFVFHATGNQNIDNEVMIGDSRLHSMPMLIKITGDETMSKFDFALSIRHNQNANQLFCAIDASLDLFDATTIDKIAQRFYSILQLFFQLNIDDQMKKQIYELPLLLPDERLLMQSINNTQVLFPSISCIHHEFVHQAMKHSQKLAVELDDQSLTYSELLHYVQVLSLHLINKQTAIVGEIVCQCVERSLSMVS
jgi:hypothetical protein